MTVRLDDLDDPDYPAFAIGRAARALGVQQAFLRALDTAGAADPGESAPSAAVTAAARSGFPGVAGRSLACQVAQPGQLRL
jgi:hypothetical protein